MHLRRKPAPKFKLGHYPAGVTIGDHELEIAARVLLHERTLLYGKVRNEQEYLRALHEAEAAHLARTATQGARWQN